jgi:phosphopantothenate synthetase
MVIRSGAAMKLEDPTSLVRWPDGERFLAFWTIGRQPIWIEVAPAGSTLVNGERVEPVDEIVRALRRRPERG